MLESPRSLERGDGLPRVSEALHDITLELFASDDAGEIAGKALAGAGRLLSVGTSSIIGTASFCATSRTGLYRPLGTITALGLRSSI